MQNDQDTPIATEGYTSTIAAKVTGLPVIKVQRWTNDGLVTPSIHQGKGRGDWDLFSFADLVALKTAARLRQSGVSLQAIRKALQYLQQHDSSITLANTYLVSDGKDMYEKRGQEMQSLLRKPGQLVFTWVIDLGAIEQEVRQALRKIA